MLLEIANDLRIAAELIPNSTRYIGIETSQPIFIGFANVVRLTGVLQDASAPNGEVLKFDLQFAPFNPALVAPAWFRIHSQGVPAAALVPAAFAQTGGVTTPLGLLRVRWRIEPPDNTTPISAGAWFQVGAWINTGLQLG